MIRFITIFLIVALLAARPAPAETVKHGPVALDVPEGWTHAVADNGTLTLRSPGEGLDAAFVLVMVAPSPPARAAATFDEFARGVTGGNHKPDRVQLRRTRDGRPARTVDAEADIEVKGRTVEQEFELVGIQGERSLLALGFVAMSWEAKRDHADAFQAMVKSLKVEGDVPPAPAAPKGRDVDGFYVKNGIQNVLNPFGGMDLIATRDYLLFRPGGFAYGGTPPAGLADDPAAIRKADPDSCGTYRVEGKKLVVTWDDEYGFLYDVEMTPAFSKKGEMTSPGDSYALIEPQRDRKLDNTYRHFTYTGGTSGNGVAIERFLRLKPDGRFEREGFVAATFNTDTPGGDGGVSGTVTSRKPANTGTYRFDGYTMTLTPDGGGPAEKYTAYLGDNAAGMLVLNDVAYLAPDEND